VWPFPQHFDTFSLEHRGPKQIAFRGIIIPRNPEETKAEAKASLHDAGIFYRFTTMKISMLHVAYSDYPYPYGYNSLRDKGSASYCSCDWTIVAENIIATGSTRSPSTLGTVRSRLYHTDGCTEKQRTLHLLVGTHERCCLADFTKARLRFCQSIKIAYYFLSLIHSLEITHSSSRVIILQCLFSFLKCKHEEVTTQ
jgi:hypothetical protein